MGSLLRTSNIYCSVEMLCIDVSIKHYFILYDLNLAQNVVDGKNDVTKSPDDIYPTKKRETHTVAFSNFHENNNKSFYFIYTMP